MPTDSAPASTDTTASTVSDTASVPTNGEIPTTAIEATAKTKETADEKSERARQAVQLINLKKKREADEQRRKDASDAAEFRRYQQLIKDGKVEDVLKGAGLDEADIAYKFIEKNGGKPRPPPTNEAEIQTLKQKLADYDKRWADREAAEQQRQVEETIRAATQRQQDFIKKDTARWEVVNALSAFDQVQQAAIAYALDEGLADNRNGRIVLRNDVDFEDVLAKAADAVEEQLVEEQLQQIDKVTKLKKLQDKLAPVADKATDDGGRPVAEWRKMLKNPDVVLPADRNTERRVAPAVGNKGLRPEATPVAPATAKKLEGADYVRDFLKRHPMKETTP
jgi:hypothetical protein